MYFFLPEAEIHCYYVSQKIIQNIKLVRAFCNVLSCADYSYFMKFSSGLVCTHVICGEQEGWKVARSAIMELFIILKVKKHHQQTYYSHINLWLNIVNWILLTNKVIERHHKGCRILIHKNSRPWFSSF